MNCKYKSMCWMYNGLTCRFKKECDITEYLQNWRDDLYNETIIDNNLQLTLGDIGQYIQVHNLEKKLLSQINRTSIFAWEDYK